MGTDYRSHLGEPARKSAVGPSLHQQVPHGGRLRRAGDDRQTKGIGGELAEQMVVGAAAAAFPMAGR